MKKNKRPGRVKSALLNWLGVPISLTTGTFWEEWFGTSSSGKVVSGTGATSGDTNALQYTVSNIFEDWQRPFPDRYTDESHQAAQPGDRIFRYVAQMAERSIYWGSKKDAPGFTYS